jgi:enoyl-CoA hydratase
MAFDYSQYGGVLIARQDKILTITLNAPETLNAFTGPMHTTMSRIWDDVNDDPDVHVVVLTGAGRAFSAGGNVIAMQQKIDDPDAWEAGMPEARRTVFRMLECDKPIIARVNGHAVGLGATVALLCDIIIAADHAKIGDPHVNAGLVAGDGGADLAATHRLRARQGVFVHWRPDDRRGGRAHRTDQPRRAG